MTNHSQEFKSARNWYWWLWLSPAVTIPTLVFTYLAGWNYDIRHLICPSGSCIGLIKDTIPILILIIISSLWHLILLNPARNKEHALIRWHGYQMFFLAGIRTIVPIILMLTVGDEEGLLYAVPVLIIIWLVGNIWGQRQASKGKCSFKDWFEKKDESAQSEIPVRTSPAKIENLETLTEIIRFSENPRERESAANTLIELGVVEYFDGTPVEQIQDTTTQPTTSSKFGLWVVGAIGVLLVFCFAVSIINTINRANYQTRILGTQRVRLTATAALAPSSIGTIQTELERAKSWPVIISDSFDLNENSWETGYHEDDSVILNSAVQDGVYRIEATSKQNFVWWDLLPTDPVSDFYLSVDARKPEGSFFTNYGLIFRESNSNFYTFKTNGSSGVYINIFFASRWASLKGNQSWGKITTDGDFTRLSVLAKDDHFYFFANDEFIGQITHHQLKSGRVGIIIEGVYLADQLNTFEFDNFELRAP